MVICADGGGRCFTKKMSENGICTPLLNKISMFYN